jgi:LPPG:FO 2-phospho-L-lactate transferase
MSRGSDGSVLLLSGGAGGARLAAGFADLLPADKLTIAVNTGDDFVHLGLPISPDVDSVVYWLAGILDEQRGWGRAGETWAFMEALTSLGGPSWFRLGDKDLAMHVERRRWLENGETLSEVTSRLSLALGITCPIVPMSDQPVATRLDTDEGLLDFQDYFVARQARPNVRNVLLEGLETAQPAPALVAALQDENLDTVIIGPSNPFVSIGPIRAVLDRAKLRPSCPVIAVSPLFGGKAVKGPTVAMMQTMIGEVSNAALARHYAGWIDALVIDAADARDEPSLEALGLKVLATPTLMSTASDRRRLAAEVLAFARNL